MQSLISSEHHIVIYHAVGRRTNNTIKCVSKIWTYNSHFVRSAFNFPYRWLKCIVQILVSTKMCNSQYFFFSIKTASFPVWCHKPIRWIITWSFNRRIVRWYTNIYIYIDIDHSTSVRTRKKLYELIKYHQWLDRPVSTALRLCNSDTVSRATPIGCTWGATVRAKFIIALVIIVDLV